MQIEENNIGIDGTPLFVGWTDGYQMADSFKVIQTNSDDGVINCLEFEFDKFATIVLTNSVYGCINCLKFELDKFANIIITNSDDLF